MCDCPADERKADGAQTAPQTVTLFKKCSKSHPPPKRAKSCGSVSDKDDWVPVDSSQSDIGYMISDGVQASLASSTCSSSSSRTYKFVRGRECECLGEAEESPWHPPVICHVPCTDEEEGEERPDIECTLAIIKPEAVIHRKQIERRIFEEGFEVYQTRWLQLTPEQVSEFYSDKYGQLHFAHLIAYMSSGPVVVHVLAKRRAVDDWKLLIGPTKVTEARVYYPDSMRARFGRRGEDFKNAIHGSCSREEAEREIHFFFPECNKRLYARSRGIFKYHDASIAVILEPLLKNEPAADYLWGTINPVLVEALSLVKETISQASLVCILVMITDEHFPLQCCKLKPADPVLWLANWLILNNPNKPKLPQDLAVIPT
ncbi:nucleoside diphosphate kinase homolog 5 [Andrena cerasifolii]|uniref:nucleoside diphosphate kinase homolog 5 n=1 Tax=Andrena cerasifolii TaxID=2819439 RepID=UPI0040380F13